MRKSAKTCLLVLVFVAIAAPVFASSGGPDASGYTWSDTVGMNWVDISTSGENIPMSDDSYATRALGFNFEYYGKSYSSVSIYSNGYLTFEVQQPVTAGQCPYPNSASPKAMIAGWFEDLNPGSVGEIYFETTGTSPNRQAVVSFYNVPQYSTGNTVTFQVLLSEGANDIKVQIQMTPYDAGANAIIGINPPTGVAGGLAAICQEAGHVPSTYAVLFKPGGTTDDDDDTVVDDDDISDDDDIVSDDDDLADDDNGDDDDVSADDDDQGGVVNDDDDSFPGDEKDEKKDSSSDDRCG